MLSHNPLRQRCQDRCIPLISPETEQLISLILQETKPQYCGEIGAAVGYSGTMIAHTIHPRAGQVYSFERAYNAYTSALSHTRHIPNLTIYPRNPLDTPLDHLIPKKLDFVFIDGQKAQYDQYLMKIQPFLHKESVVLCDDVIKFQNKLLPLYGYLQEMQIFYHTMQIEADDGVMLIGDPSVIKPLIEKWNKTQQSTKLKV